MEILSNELRIGNLIMWEDESNDIITITGIVAEKSDEEPAIYTNKNELAALFEFKPIPLTEEWLVKFGFEINTPNLRWMHSGMIADVYKTESGNLTLLQNGSYLTNKPIKYVHQLQNLYFALTGEELVDK